jgi:hypothetical protein
MEISGRASVLGREVWKFRVEPAFRLASKSSLFRPRVGFSRRHNWASEVALLSRSFSEAKFSPQPFQPCRKHRKIKNSFSPCGKFGQVIERFPAE